MIGAVAELTVKEGSQAEFEKIALELEQAVNANEPGIVFYKLFKVRDTTNKYVFMEQYADAAAVDAHRGYEHFKRLGRAMGPFLDGAPTVTRMDKVT
jgi:quinol monooxygenase YgiN